MRGFKPNAKLWKRVNKVIMGENAAVVVVTFQSAMCQMIIQSGACTTEDEARVCLAASLLSPDDNPKVGSLADRLPAEFARLKDGKWLV